jgi:ribonuclease P protein component
MPPKSSAAQRLSGNARFTLAVRSGRRASSFTLVVHLALTDSGDPPRIGFVVSRAVGNAVTRNRVKRRLRALLRGHDLPAGALLVVRALPPAAGASYPELRTDLVRCLSRVTP